MTQKHIVVFGDTGIIQWLFKYDPNNTTDEELLPFKLDKSIQYENSPIVNAYYNHEYTKILASTANGSLVVFPIEAESNILEDDED